MELYYLFKNIATITHKPWTIQTIQLNTFDRSFSNKFLLIVKNYLPCYVIGPDGSIWTINFLPINFRGLIHVEITTVNNGNKSTAVPPLILSANHGENFINSIRVKKFICYATVQFSLYIWNFNKEIYI